MVTHINQLSVERRKDYILPRFLSMLATSDFSDFEPVQFFQCNGGLVVIISKKSNPDIKYAVKTVSNRFRKAIRRTRGFVDQLETDVECANVFNTAGGHANIVKCFQVVETKQFTFMFMEYMATQDLLDEVVAHGAFSEQRVMHIVRDVLKALKFSHSLNIAHMDLSPENLGTQDGVTRVCDFGFAREATLVVNPRTLRCGKFGYTPVEVNAHTYTHAHMHTYTHTHMHTYTHTHIHTYTHTHMHTYTHTHIHTYTHTHIHTYTHTHIHTCTHAHMHTYTHTHMHTYTHTHMHTYTHTHIHTYTHTHIHTYTHTHIHTYTHAHIHTYTHTHIHTYTHTHIHTYTHTHMHTCTHAHIHTYTHAHIHTYTHAHIHTYTHTTHTHIHTYTHTHIHTSHDMHTCT